MAAAFLGETGVISHAMILFFGCVSPNCCLRLCSPPRAPISGFPFLLGDILVAAMLRRLCLARVEDSDAVEPYVAVACNFMEVASNDVCLLSDGDISMPLHASYTHGRGAPWWLSRVS